MTPRAVSTPMLKNNGYVHLTMAESSKRALWVIQQQPADLVVTDWTMPNMTGIELLKWIKGDPDLYTIPVVMISDERSTDKVLYAVEEREERLEIYWLPSRA